MLSGSQLLSYLQDYIKQFPEEASPKIQTEVFIEKDSCRYKWHHGLSLIQDIWPDIEKFHKKPNRQIAVTPN